MLTFVIADIHGRLDLLEKCLAAAQAYSPSGGIIYFLGDYVDRGPNSKGVLDRLTAAPPPGWTWKFIRGNHEDMMLDAVAGRFVEHWLQFGGKQTVQSYAYTLDPKHLEWVEKLPRLLWDDLRVYTHAGVSEFYDLTDQPERMTQWYRYPDGADVGHRGRHVVHGHTIVESPELRTNRTNLDIGGYHTGKMAVGVFNDTQGSPIDLIFVKE